MNPSLELPPEVKSAAPERVSSPSHCNKSKVDKNRSSGNDYFKLWEFHYTHCLVLSTDL